MSGRQLKKRKLQAFQVVRIRAMYKEGFRLKTLSIFFGVSPAAIFQIVNFSTYKDVK
jgi:hypothetical protein